MKNLKRQIALLTALVCLCCGGLLPSLAAAEETNNWDMEIWTDPSEPDGFTVTPGEGAVVSYDDKDILGNKSKKIKISHPEETTTADTITTVTFTVPQEAEITTMSAGYYLSFWLESLTVPEGVVDVGVKFGVVAKDRWASSDTEYFKDTTYQKWRKMMRYTDGTVYAAPAFTVTFKGVGVVYLDNLEVELTNGILNGDFEGVSGDNVLATAAFFTPTGSGASPLKSLRSEEEITTEVLAGISAGLGQWYFVETDENNYLMSVKSNCNIQYKTGTQSCDLEDGKHYRVTVSNKSLTYSGNLATGCQMSVDLCAGLPTAEYNGKRWAKATENWTDKSISFVYRFGDSYPDRKQIAINFGGNISGTEDDPGSFCYFDNVRVKELTTAATLKDEAGTEIKNLVRGEKVTVHFEVPTLDWETDLLAEAKVDGYETKKKVLMAAALYRKDGTSLQLEEIYIRPEVAGKSDNGGKMANSTDTLSFGYLPAQDSFDFEIPLTGDYEVRIMAWDSMGVMTPAAAQAYTYTTASAS